MKTTIPSVGSIGVNKDQLPHELPISALTEVSNIRMRNGCAERISGESQVFTTPPVVPYFICLYRTSSTRFTAYAGLAAVYVDDGTTLTDITGTVPGGSTSDKWTGGTLNSVLVLNNGYNLPTYWAGNVANNLATLTGWDATWKCQAMRPFKNYLIGMNWTKNTSYYPNMVKWSSAADPGTIPTSWNEADPAVDAGETDLSETAGILVDGLALGDMFVLYKTDSMYAMTYIGGQYIWQFRKLQGDIGILARGCVCDTPSGHLVLTVGDVVIHNGGNPQSILTGSMREWLFETMDQNYSDSSFVMANPAMNEAWVCFPESGSSVCTKALIWNWKDNTVSLRALANATCGTAGQYEYSSNADWASDVETWADDLTSWNASDLPATQTRFLLGTSEPKILGIDIGTDFDGTTFTATIERTGLIFDNPEAVKLVRSVFPRIDGTTGGTVYIQIGSTMDVEGSYAWSDAIPYVIGATYRADVFASGRAIGYRIYSTTTMQWRVKSIDIDVVYLGAY